jgi:hypothetical protein
MLVMRSDGDELRFKWFHYLNVTQRVEGRSPFPSEDVKIEDVVDIGSVVPITPQHNHVMSTLRSALS